MKNTVFLLLFLLPCSILVIWLQLKLSQASSKWIGLILPFCSVMNAVIIALGQVGFQRSTSTTNGGPEAIAVAVTFILLNVPTFLLLALYAARREKYKRKIQHENNSNEISKMNIQDL